MIEIVPNVQEEIGLRLTREERMFLTKLLEVAQISGAMAHLVAKLQDKLEAANAGDGD